MSPCTVESDVPERTRMHRDVGLLPRRQRGMFLYGTVGSKVLASEHAKRDRLSQELNAWLELLHV